jgi:para-nitrobenzyl esterase
MRKFIKQFQTPGLFLILLLGLSTIIGCGPSGVFMDSPVAGLTYQTQAGSHTITAQTTNDGIFYYKENETITFSVGDLQLGSSIGKAVVTPLDLVEGAASAADQRVTNRLVLLQTLDEDGDLNNGIKISNKIAAIVSTYAGSINFDQTATAFAADTNVKALLLALNTAGVFNDTDPRPRTLRGATAAQEHFARSMSERKIVHTQSGLLSGYAVNNTNWQWLGIPYAKAPIGDLRWRPPKPVMPWMGVRDAIAWGDQAAQNPAYQAYGEGGMSEDCLYLNITAPKDAANLPVMVWFHGGAFSILTGNTKSYNNPTGLPAKGVVQVSVNHRLGPFGYLAHPLLTAESGYGGSGNYGQMDLIAALKWVKKNIAAFGGDPNNVTIFGQSGGGGKSISLMASLMAKGLFHKVICQSGMTTLDGGFMSGASLAEAEAKGSSLFARLGVTTLAEARALPWTTVIARDIIDFGANAWLIYAPNIDNYYMTDTMKNLIAAGLESDVPMMAGSTSADMAGLAPGLVEQMPWRSSHNSAPQFVYKWSYVPAGWAAIGVGAYHGIELVYTFNYPASFYSHYLLGLTGLPVDYTKPPAAVVASTGYGLADVMLTDTVMTMWTNFAKTGDPSTATFTWPAYTTANDTFVEIGSTITVQTGLVAAFP